MSLDFLFLYEHIAREFESISLIMAELENRGYSCDIMQLMSRKKIKYFTYDKPKVIVPSAMYNNETLNSFVYNNVGKLQKVVNLHWEQVLSREQEESRFYSFAENARKCTHICWGEKAKKRIMGNGVPEKNAVVTGAVQMDFLNERFNALDKSRDEIAKQYNLDTNKQWLLYISSFSCAYMDDKEIEELNEMTNLDFYGFKQLGIRSMEKTLEMIDKLLEKHPEFEFIYRPHPCEWQSPPLEEMKKKHKNFYVITDYPVKQWIKTSDTILMWMSTSIAEVYFAGKSCIVIRPEPIFDDYDPVTFEGVNAVENFEQLETAISSKEIQFPIDKEMLLSHYDNGDGFAYIRIADLLEQTLKQPPQDLPFSKGYKPRKNVVKFFALIGLNLFVTLKINPKWFSFLGQNFVQSLSRFMGYISKSRVSKKRINDMKQTMKGLIN